MWHSLLPARMSSGAFFLIRAHLLKRLDKLRNNFGRFSLAGASITDTQKLMQEAIRTASRTKPSRRMVEQFVEQH